MNKGRVLLIFLGLLVSLPLISASCCQPSSQGNIDYCIDSEEFSPAVGGYITQYQCTAGLNGNWFEDSCEDISTCQSVCCCNSGTQPNTFVGDLISDYACSTTSYSGITDATVCDQTCQPPTSPAGQYWIQGQVLDQQGEIVVGAIVRTVPIMVAGVGETPIIDPVYTDSVGRYRVQVRAGTYQLIAQKEQCVGQSAKLSINAHTDVFLTLTNCEGGPITECTPQVWDCQWQNNVQECGFAKECVPTIPATEACTYPSAPIYAPCPQGACDHDGTIDYGEQCDGSNLGGASCLSLGFYSGTLSCAPDCTYESALCVACYPDEVAPACTPDQCNVCYNCPLEYCPSLDCTEYVPSVAITPKTGQDSATIVFTYQGSGCASTIEQIRIEQCEGEGEACKPGGEHITATYLPESIGREEWTTPHLEELKEYCYIIHTTMRDAQGGYFTTSTDASCFETGNEACMQEHAAEVCAEKDSLVETTANGPNIRAYCDQSNFLRLLDNAHARNKEEPYDCEEDPCVGPNAQQETMCGSKTLCEMCNSLYADYSYLSISVPFNVNGQTQQVLCSHNLIREYCYTDTTITVADKKYSCSEISSCYDYRSADQCQSNPCRIGNLDCEWKNLLGAGAELGIGVCRPTAQEEHDCVRCNTNNYNSPECTKDLCSLYGECYFSMGDEEEPYNIANTCWNAEDLGCAFYTTEEECTDGHEADVDVTYDEFDQRVAGTNILTPSQDLNDFGTCKWRGACIKDADGSEESGEGDDDCLGQPLKCYSDNTPPTTTFHSAAAYGGGEGLVLTTTTADNAYEQLTTYYGLTPQNNYWAPITSFPEPDGMITGAEACEELDGACTKEYCWALHDGDWTCYTSPFPASFVCNNLLEPDMFSSEVADEDAMWYLQAFNDGAWKVRCNKPTTNSYPTNTLVQLQALTIPSGQYTLSYYSEDPSHNIEQVRQATITIDGTPPELIDYDVALTEYEFHDDDWRTNVIIKYTFNEEHTPIRCDSTLESTIITDEPSTYEAMGISFEEHHNELKDDQYEHTLTCNDQLGNSATYTHTITLQADQSILNPSPRMETLQDGQSVEISIETTETADCYYDFAGQTHLPFERETTSDGYEYSATLEELDPNHTYVIPTGCRFAASGETHEGNPGDLIIFAIDQLPPRADLIDEDTGGIYIPNGQFTNEKTFSILCDDTHPDLGVGDTSLAWGLKARYYCIGSETTPCSLKVAGETITLDYLDVTQSAYLYYTCKDKGDNQAATKKAPLYIRDTTFRSPQVGICGIDGCIWRN